MEAGMRVHPVAPPGKGRFSAGAACAAAAIALWPASAQAQVATGELEVRLIITDSCDISGSTGGSLGNAVLDFGTHSLLTGAIDADTGTGATALEVLCNPGVDYTLTFGPGQNASDIANRAMERESGTDLVRYQLYTTAARNTVLNTISGTGTGTVQPIVIYGQVPAQATPPAGSYRDVVTITMSF
jgi:spore coat protein U-like protein